VFALSAQDAGAVLDVAACFDLHDPFARKVSSTELRSLGPEPRIGVPLPGDLEFFGDREAGSLFAAAMAKLEQIGGTRVRAAFAPFREAGRLLYNGPLVWPSACPTIAATIAAAGSARAVCEKLEQEIEDLNRFIRLDRAH
jgi:allophanate hydrolase